jgi:simple sugar transport system ATP-binding protein
MHEPRALSLPAIEFVGVGKTFGRIAANRDVSFSVEPGSIHGIVGENGAGKTTLMSILFGLYQIDEGGILINGQPANIRAPSDAIHHGIGMVHQHFMLVDKMTALQNVILGAESGHWLAKGVGRGRAEVEQIQEKYGLAFPLDEHPRDLSVGVQQRIEIVKALFRHVNILILDEPTGVLTPQEVTSLFEVMRELKAAGNTVILITHKLNEIIEITDRVTVLRQGECVSTVETSAVTKSDLAEMMVGRKVNQVRGGHSVSPGNAKIVVSDLVVKGRTGECGVNNLNFSVHSGEILGVAGVSGNGQSELLDALAGLRGVDVGEIAYPEHKITAHTPVSAREVRQIGISHIPEDRGHIGLIGQWSALENSIFGNHWSDELPGVGKVMEWRAIQRWCQKLMTARDVRPADPLRKMSGFSGGNQQKMLIGREMALDPDILIIGQPTRGVDVGAIEAIHQDLLAQRDKGKALFLVSVELEEIMALSDRVLVLFEGRSMGELSRDEMSENLIGLMMAGTEKSDAMKAEKQRAVVNGTVN